MNKADKGNFDNTLKYILMILLNIWNTLKLYLFTIYYIYVTEISNNLKIKFSW